jgi:diguanylate cyclase (GGDEF)-like protein
VGDAVLRTLGQLLEATLRASDFAARTGGDELVVLFGGATPAEAAAASERIRGVIAAHDWSQVAAGLEVTVSIGVSAAIPTDTVETLMQRADRRMYERKDDRRTG